MKESLIGNTYGRLTVVSDGPTVKSKSTSLCKCSCGNTDLIQVYNKYLKNGDTKSCGCLKREVFDWRRKDLSGQRFGRLTAVSKMGIADDGHTIWKCICDCGRETDVLSNALMSGGTKSCGCLKAEQTSLIGKRTGPMHVASAQRAAKIANTTHGMTGSRLYHIWQMMIQRCENPKHDHYAWYGAKGVTVAPEWHSFEVFKKWADNAGYTDELTIDRINSIDMYCAENCRWITKSENSARASAGKRRYWCLDLNQGFYAEFDQVSAFLNKHDEINMLPQHVYDILRGKVQNAPDVQFGEID